MTVTGKQDATGRASGKLKIRHNKIAGQFIAHKIEMISSPAWAAFSFPARRVLDRLEIEHAGHGGRENGSLICTYDDFKAFGIRRSSVSQAMRELVVLGFVEVTQQGRMAAADFYAPSRYRLTYLNTKEGPTDDWRKIASAEDAAAKLEGAKPQARLSPRKNGEAAARPLATALPVGARAGGITGVDDFKSLAELLPSQDIDRRPVFGPGHVDPFSGPEPLTGRPVFGSGPGPVNGSGKMISGRRLPSTRKAALVAGGA
jgi:hypothetical protein